MYFSTITTKIEQDTFSQTDYFKPIPKGPKEVQKSQLGVRALPLWGNGMAGEQEGTSEREVRAVEPKQHQMCGSEHRAATRSLGDRKQVQEPLWPWFSSRHRTVSLRGWIVSPPCLQIRMWRFKPPVIQNMTIFGDRAFEEVTKVKWGPCSIWLVSLQEKEGRT